jgi:nucleoside-diphosphate-sugar epimerase
VKPILITGAAGNLGSLTARHLLGRGYPLHLMTHERPLPPDLAGARSRSFVADLGRPETIAPACEGVGAVVHYAGVLFKPRPEAFLPVTNFVYFQNLVAVALDRGVDRIVLVSFPHVEGESSPEAPARGVLTGRPESVHARTRLEEERHLIEATEGTGVTPVVLRAGMVYGRGILMIDAARWLARRRLLGVWRRPTWIHLISIVDFLRAVEAAVVEEGVRGIYHVGDDGRETLQEFLDAAARHWGSPKPWRMPVWLIALASGLVELYALLFRTRAPLTRDFVRIGMASYYGDTTRMKRDLLAELRYPTFREGIELL